MQIEAIKQKINILDIASRYTGLKKVNHITYKAVENPLRDERTSSLFFYIDTQRYYDFGSGEKGDALDFIAKMENLSLLQAKKKLEEEIAGCNVIIQRRQRSQRIQKPSREKEISTETIAREFKSFEKIDFSNQEHLKELLEIAPEWLYKQANKADLEFFKSICRYDKTNKTLIMAWYLSGDLEFKIIAYKRRRYKGGKWTNRAGTHINKIPLYRLYNDEPIFIVEGAHDFLTAVLLGLNVIALPTASFTNMSDLRAIIGVNDRVVCIAEDEQGYKCMEQAGEAIKDIAKQVKVIGLNDDSSIKVDLSDYIFKLNSIKEFQDVYKNIEKLF